MLQPPDTWKQILEFLQTPQSHPPTP
jgi:hypothetical protein